MSDMGLGELWHVIMRELRARHYENDGAKGLRQLFADAELGRLVRRMPRHTRLLRLVTTWLADMRAQEAGGLPAWAEMGDTPEEALRKALGEIAHEQVSQ